MRWLAAVVALAACHREAPRVVVEVEVEWPGTSAEDMARSIATPLERTLGQMPRVVALTSVSREGKTVVRVEVTGNRDGALADARAAVDAADVLLPGTLPAPPQVRAPGASVERGLVSPDQAEQAVMWLERLHGVTRVETCGLARKREEIVVDPASLAATGLTLADVRAAIVSANVNVPAGQIDAGSTSYTLATNDAPSLPGSLLLAYRNGAPVKLSDVARVQDGFAPMACVVAPRGMVEVDVQALHGGIVDDASVKHLRLAVVPARPELHGELDPALTPDAALARISDAVGADPAHRAIGEIRGNQLVVHGASPAVVDRLRRTVGVVTLGERTATVHIFGADPQAVAEVAHAIADRLRGADQLVATHGLTMAPTLRTEIDRPAAARLDIMVEQITDALAANHGAVVSKIVTQQDEIELALRVADASKLNVWGTNNTLVPLTSVVRFTQTTAPLEVLHRAQLPDVDLEVHGDPHDAIGKLPPGVQVEISD